MENFDLEKMAFDRAVERGWHPDSLATRRVANEIIEAVKFGFNAHEELTKDKLFTAQEVIDIVEKSRETGLTAEYFIAKHLLQT